MEVVAALKPSLFEEVPPADIEALDLHGRGPRGGEPTPLPPLDPPARLQIQ